MEEKQIALNKGFCGRCNEVLVSYHRHDFVTCSCGASSLDGGNDYIRLLGDTVVEPIYTDDDFEIVRKHAVRGSRGPNGDQPLSWITICDMTDDHLEAVLEYGGPAWHLELIRREIEWRKGK